MPMLRQTIFCRNNSPFFSLVHSTNSSTHWRRLSCWFWWEIFIFRLAIAWKIPKKQRKKKRNSDKRKKYMLKFDRYLLKLICLNRLPFFKKKKRISNYFLFLPYYFFYSSFYCYAAHLLSLLLLLPLLLMLR